MKYELLAFYKPDYGIINNKIIQEIIIRFRNQDLLKQLVILSSKLKMQLIAPYVNSYLIYKKLKSLNIPLIFGNLIAHDEKPIKTLSNDILFLLNK